MRMRTAFPVLCLLFAGLAQAENHTVTVSSNRFSPAQLTINVGDTVTFTNAGGFHNASADDGSFRCAQGCDGVGNGNGNPSNNTWSATVSFDAPGVHPYRCEVHGDMGMTGTITVEGTAPPAFPMNQHGIAGSWANAATESQGVVMDVFPDFYAAGTGLLFGGWFTFDTTAAGGLRWYTVQGQVGNDDSATMAVYQTLGGSFDSAQATTTHPVGEVT
ncbi:cupredoxin domain-containing protein, partial [Dokdonella fugitiva]|uniref:cupredoxin domain-containing protein n=1 Tax=Dokdonella fugitiva TaxID=328517 RepID=UPI0015FB7888